jgi:capsular polysaccharide biosynthesis protein
MALSGTQAPTGFARAAPESEFPFSLRDIVQVILRRLWMVLLVTLVFVGVTVGVSLSQTPTYEASSKLWVIQKQDAQEANLAGSVEGLQQLTLTMIVAINSRPVAEEAIQRLGLKEDPEDLLESMTVEQIESTTFIELTYADANPEKAQRVVNTLSEVASERIAETSAAGNNITATVYEEAVVPDAPVSPSPVRNGAVAVALGLMLGIGLALLMEHMDDSWRSPEEVEQISGVPNFATVPAFKLARSKRKKGF